LLVVRCGRPYVLKNIGCSTVNAANQALLEAACLQRIQHPGVVRFEDVFLHRHDNGGCSVVIVMEFCAGGDLIDRIQCARGEMPLTEAQILHFLASLCRTLGHVHGCGILHRDLKSSNIFITRNDRSCKLGDFGLACSGLSRRRLTGSPRRHSRCGTDLYMSPEVENRRPYGASSDTYGLGCVLLEMLLQGQLRERRRFEERKEAIRSALDLARRKHGWQSMEELSGLAWKMLDDNPKNRIELPAAAATADACLAALQLPTHLLPVDVAASVAYTVSGSSSSDNAASVGRQDRAAQWRLRVPGRKTRYAD